MKSIKRLLAQTNGRPGLDFGFYFSVGNARPDRLRSHGETHTLGKLRLVFLDNIPNHLGEAGDQDKATPKKEDLCSSESELGS